MPRDSLPNKAMLIAYEKGYRVDSCGVLIGPGGENCSVNLSSTRYPIKSFQIEKGTPGISMYLHKLMAYQKFGEAMFEPGIQVRHLNGNRSDCSFGNIAIGTQSQNMLDIPKEKRGASIKAANARKKTPDEMIARVGQDWSSGIRIPELCKKYRLKDYCIQKILQRYRVEILGEKIKPFIPKFDEDDIRDIRIACGMNNRTQREIGEDYGVGQGTISKIITGEIYAYVKD